MTEADRRRLVLLPGFMADHGLWAAMADGLAELGDWRSADLGPDDEGQDEGGHDLAGMAARALAAAPPRFIALGFSMGGYVAREMVRQAPARVAGLVLVNTSARPTDDATARRNRRIAEVTRANGFRGLAPAAVRGAVHPDRRADARLTGAIQAMAQRLGERAFLDQIVLDRPDGRPALAAIACPALVVWSRQDRLRTLDEARELADGIPGARLEIIEDCGHMTPLEQPARLLAVLRGWLAETGL